MSAGLDKGEKHRDAMGKVVKTAVLLLHAGVDIRHCALPEHLQMAVSFREMVDEKGSRCRRRLHPLERDHVEDALVALVSYARDDGQREVGYVLGEGQRVEAAHVGSGTTATDDHHGVEVVGPVKDVVQCPDDAVLDLLALHDSRKERVGEVETVVVVVKLIAEVTESGGLFTGDDRDMLGEEWERGRYPAQSMKNRRPRGNWL